jgi:hypothetical protein
MSASAPKFFQLTDPAEAARRVAALNMELAREREIPDRIAAAVDDIVSSMSETGTEQWLTISPELAMHVLRSIIDAQQALIRPDEGLAPRNALRSALGRLSQALGLIAEGSPVSPDRSPKEVARWLIETLDVPQREIAAVLGVPLRTFQRWVSAAERAEPEGEDSDRLRVLAAVVNQLRFGLTGSGIIRWFDVKNAWLDGKRPRTLLSDPLEQPRLLSAARALREGAGS